MKTLLTVAVLALAAGCATGPRVELLKIDPDARTVESNPYSDYDRGMRSDKDRPMAYEWQSRHQEDLAEALKPSVLAGFVASESAAAGLLAKVKDNYRTDPVVAIQIAAVSQMVMCTDCPKAPKNRWRWTTALVSAARESVSPYRTMFFLDQLRWCGHIDDANDVMLIRDNALTKDVADFADQVMRELKAAAK